MAPREAPDAAPADAPATAPTPAPTTAPTGPPTSAPVVAPATVPVVVGVQAATPRQARAIRAMLRMGCLPVASHGRAGGEPEPLRFGYRGLTPGQAAGSGTGLDGGAQDGSGSDRVRRTGGAQRRRPLGRRRARAGRPSARHGGALSPRPRSRARGLGGADRGRKPFGADRIARGPYP